MLLLPLLLACSRPTPAEPVASAETTAPAPIAEDPSTVAARERMIQTQLESRDITDGRVLAAMRSVPRHRFMPESSWSVAYYDGAAPIGHGQTISQPYIVAFMTQSLGVSPGMKVLEIGTGSGYQAAVLSAIGATVYSIEIVQPLAKWADGALRAAGFPVVESDEAPGAARSADSPLGAIHLRTGDGYQGWPEVAPFDRIIVTAAPDHVPPRLKEQVAIGGQLLLPVGGDGLQHLVLLQRTAEGWQEERILPVRFVPMTGEAEGR